MNNSNTYNSDEFVLVLVPMMVRKSELQSSITMPPMGQVPQLPQSVPEENIDDIENQGQQLQQTVPVQNGYGSTLPPGVRRSTQTTPKSEYASHKQISYVENIIKDKGMSVSAVCREYGIPDLLCMKKGQAWQFINRYADK